MAKFLSLIVSVYNEEACLREFYDNAAAVLSALGEDYTYEICFVNDGSRDGSAGILRELRALDFEHVGIVTLSRNFGHEAAMTAGLDYARGDICIFMDADLQHPPKLIPQILEAFDEGAEVVVMARTANDSAGNLKNAGSGLFYRLINRISDASLVPGASDFFALDARAADVLRASYRDQVRFMRGYVQNIGFKKSVINYEAPGRAAGESHYSLKSLVKLCVDTIICFSDLPLRIGIYLGFLSGMLGAVLIIYTLFTRGTAPGGYATLVITLCFMFAVTFVLLGVIGMYISLLYRELRDRPIYIAENVERAGGKESSCIDNRK